MNGNDLSKGQPSKLLMTSWWQAQVLGSAARGLSAQISCVGVETQLRRAAGALVQGRGERGDPQTQQQSWRVGEGAAEDSALEGQRQPFGGPA